MAKIQIPTILGGNGGKSAKVKAGAKMAAKTEAKGESKAEGKAKSASASAPAGTPPSCGSAGQRADLAQKLGLAAIVVIEDATRPATGPQRAPLDPAAALAVSGFALGLGLALLPARLGLAALAACAEC